MQFTFREKWANSRIKGNLQKYKNITQRIWYYSSMELKKHYLKVTMQCIWKPESHINIRGIIIIMLNIIIIIIIIILVKLTVNKKNRKSSKLATQKIQKLICLRKIISILLQSLHKHFLKKTKTTEWNAWSTDMLK